MVSILTAELNAIERALNAEHYNWETSCPSCSKSKNRQALQDVHSKHIIVKNIMNMRGVSVPFVCVLGYIGLVGNNWQTMERKKHTALYILRLRSWLQILSLL